MTWFKCLFMTAVWFGQKLGQRRRVSQVEGAQERVSRGHNHFLEELGRVFALIVWNQAAAQ